MKNSLIASLALFVAMPAHALVGGTVDANLASSPWAGVGAVKVNGGTYSGALIGNQYVLTAAHVVGGATPGQVQFVLNAGGAPSQTLAAESIHVFSGYQGTTSGADGVWHDDLALVKLAAPVAAGVPVYDLYNGPLLGKTVSLVGYGAGGDGVNGATIAQDDNLKRAGQNRIDLTLVDDDGGSQYEIFLFDFDGPDSTTNVFGANNNPQNLTLGAAVEAQYAGGDSGSPLFVNDNGTWKLAGIAAFNASVTGLPGSNVKFGAVGGGSIVAPYATWIQATIAVSVSAPVPEPETWLMLLAGLGLVGVARVGKSRADAKI
ncbi:MAG: trypsin-like serine protease [Pseudomonadota bacterium]|nr:trypsin-like serine protease [Pseudomonadota bacterium]